MIPFIFLLQFTLSVASTPLNDSSADAIISQIKEGREQRELDYFKLTLQWPGTVCKGTDSCCSSNACCNRSGAFADFTIHGLWPDYNDGTWPSCCNGTSFDEKEIHTLLDPLKKYWPSLSCSSSTCHGGKGSFWAHEKVLNDAGYLPSNTEKYPLGGIVSAVENAFHVTPSLACSEGALQELRLCFYKDLKPRDCVQTDSQSGIISSNFSCPQYVSLPAYEPSGNIFKLVDSS
ncbi:ribonuclease 2-like isoform X2 [Cucurbita pepo subsp. pepo]|uniref:ribonuclease 2-like isoform X2 n=1 Tax=Cucurbita pepo subsp. pepo TaxID=3664 RepID=UPI000C9D825F|nr:ribonuclease 2-like isoform X2 [Cucurbita pepo subsp. pepo]